MQEKDRFVLLYRSESIADLEKALSYIQTKEFEREAFKNTVRLEDYLTDVEHLIKYCKHSDLERTRVLEKLREGLTIIKGRIEIAKEVSSVLPP